MLSIASTAFNVNVLRPCAEVGCSELGWRMTVSGVGHCRQVGCPESGVDAAVAALVQRGFKVGRIEQMETAAQAKARMGNKAVIRRELAAVGCLTLVLPFSAFFERL